MGRKPVTLMVASTYDLAVQDRPTVSVVVSRRVEETPDIASLFLRGIDDDTLPAWTPGAHIALRLGNGMERQYSLCGSPTDHRTWQIAVLRDPHTRGGSSWIHQNLRVGSTLEVTRPRNNFHLDRAGRTILIAGGIGITPLLPMIQELDREQRDWSLLYGGRARASMAFVDALQAYGGRVEIWPEDERGLPGIQNLLAEPTDDTLIYCCGPGGLIEAVTRLTSGRWPHQALRTELFRAAEVCGGPADEFEVEALRSGATVSVPPGTSMASALAQAGVGVVTSCAEGVCGTCETRVLEGVPDHRDSYLTEDERCANETVMLCVSRALSPRLVLDL